MATEASTTCPTAPTARIKRPVGTYIPPAKRVKQENFDIGSEDHQRLLWDENKRKITGLINRASVSNVTTIIRELFQCNLIRYRGLFATALLKAQETSPEYTEVYAAILAVINSRLHNIGALVVNRLVLQYRISFVNNNKPKCLAAAKFVAHLTNQEVVHEALAFQIIDLLINKPTPASIEITIAFIKECGAKLEQLNSHALFEIFKTFRELTLEHDFDSRTHEMIDLIHVIRKDRFKNYPPIKKALDLVDEDDKVTLAINLDEPSKKDFNMQLNYFQFDSNWAQKEAKYDDFRKSLLEDEDTSSEESDEEDNTNEEGDDKKDVKALNIIDSTQKDIIDFRKMVYSTIRSCISHEEVVHQLMKARIKPELNEELCQMIIDFCGSVSHYETITGLIASKLCLINRREFAPKFEKIFQLFYEAIHRISEQNKIRNIAKFFAHLLTTESIDWQCLSCIRLRANATSSCGRVFISFLFQELVSILSLPVLIEYIHEPSKEGAFHDLFPKDNEEDIRFAINFFTSCGFGQLTEELRASLDSGSST